MSERPLPDLLETLSHDTRAYVDAEIVRVRLEAEQRIKHFVQKVTLALVVLSLLAVALHFLATAAARSLTPWAGAIGAPLAVGGGVLLVALTAAAIGLRPPPRREPLPPGAARKELGRGDG